MTLAGTIGLINSCTTERSLVMQVYCGKSVDSEFFKFA